MLMLPARDAVLLERRALALDRVTLASRFLVPAFAKRIESEGVIDSTVGMYGDLQGIAGRAMQEIPAPARGKIDNGEVHKDARIGSGCRYWI
jgi:hypothetical protein